LRAILYSISAVILSVGLLQIGNGLQTDLISVRADIAGFGAGTIGWMMATYYVGYSLAPLSARLIIGKLGHVGAIVVCAVAASAMILVHPFLVTPASWACFRFVSGFALSLVYVGYESWINDRAPNAERGRIFAVYIVVQMAAMLVAQYLLGLGNPAKIGPWVLTSALFASAAVPVLVARRSAPDHAPPAPLGLARLFATSPLGAGATVLAGVSWSVLFTFGPIFAKHVGFGLAGTGLFMALAMGTSGVLQLPLGWLSDIAGRRRVIALMFVLGLVASLFGLWAASHGITANLVAVAATGGFVFPLYAISVAHVNDVTAQDARVAAAASLVLLFGLGSIAGPLLSGWAFAAMGPMGLYAILAATMIAGLAVAARWR
jgi:MFS family permease